jgi:hypothetical protein
MAITYNWEIQQLECYAQHEGHVEVVFSIHWRRQATDGVYTAGVYGSQAIALAPGVPFTPFAELDKPQVEGWLVAAMGGGKIAALDAELDKQIEHQKNPPVVTPALPWEQA